MSAADARERTGGRPVLTRPRRRIAYGAGLAILWLSLMILALQQREHAWVSSGPASSVGTETRVFGLVPYLTITRENVGLTVVTPPPGIVPSTSWEVHPLGITLSIAFAVALGAGIVLVYRWQVERDRLVGRCDECGYDMRGSTGDRCPECGAAQPGRRA